MTSYIDKYNIKPGDIYISCDGARHTHTVVGLDKDKDDVLTVDGTGRECRIDAWKLHCVRYARVENDT